MTEDAVKPEPVAVITVAPVPAFTAAGGSEVSVTAGGGVVVEPPPPSPPPASLPPPPPPQAAAAREAIRITSTRRSCVSVPCLIETQLPLTVCAGCCYAFRLGARPGKRATGS